jgi:hypothetical protein
VLLFHTTYYVPASLILKLFKLPRVINRIHVSPHQPHCPTYEFGCDLNAQAVVRKLAKLDRRE